MAIVWVYSHGTDGPFIFDDYLAIVNNPTFDDGSLITVLKGKRDTSYSSRPLTNLSFAIDYYFYGLDPTPYRWTNIVIQTLIAWVLLGLLSRIIPLYLNTQPINRSLTGWLALITTLMWALHPVQTECVLYITQRSEQFAMLGFVLSIDGLIRHHLTGKRRWLVMMFLSCTISMGFKQNAAVLPIVLFLIDYALLTGSFKKSLKTRWKSYLSTALVTWAITTAILIYDPNPACTGTGFGVSRWEYLMTQSQVILHYFKNAYWPSGLCLYYDWPIVRDFGQVIWEFSAVGLLFVLGCLALIKLPRLGCCIVSVYLILGPSSSVLPLVTEVAADRRLHIILALLLLLPIMMMISVLLRLNQSMARTLRITIILSLFATLSYSVKTVQLSVFYNNPVVLWEHNIQQTSSPQAAWEQLGGIYDRRKQWAPAWQCYHNAIALEPDFLIARLNLGYVEMKLKRHKHALQNLGMLINDPIHGANALHYLGIHYKQNKEFKIALRYLQEAHALKPSRDDIALNLAGIYNLMGEPTQARDLLEPFVTRPHIQIQIYSELGVSYSKLGVLKKAQWMYQRYLKEIPNDAKILNSMGVVQAKLGHIDNAAQYFARALMADPTLEEARDNLKHARQMLGTSVGQ